MYRRVYSTDAWRGHWARSTMRTEDSPPPTSSIIHAKHWLALAHTAVCPHRNKQVTDVWDESDGDNNEREEANKAKKQRSKFIHNELAKRRKVNWPFQGPWWNVFTAFLWSWHLYRVNCSTQLVTNSNHLWCNKYRFWGPDPYWMSVSGQDRCGTCLLRI